MASNGVFSTTPGFGAVVGPIEQVDTAPMAEEACDPSVVEEPRLGTPEFAGMSDVGRVRDNNEDNFAIARLHRWVGIQASSLEPDASEWPGDEQGILLAVADGVGGHSGGEVASAVVLDAFIQYAARVLAWFGTEERDDERVMTRELAAAVEICRRRLTDSVAPLQLEGREPGTTLTAVYVAWPVMYLVHAGDSRCYRLSGSGALEQLTRDHTLAQRCVERGEPVESPERRLGHVLYNAIGGGVDHMFADVSRYELRLGDTILLCTDGLSDRVDDAAIARALGAAGSAEQLCATLIEQANEGGGADNVTVVVGRF